MKKYILTENDIIFTKVHRNCTLDLPPTEGKTLQAKIYLSWCADKFFTLLFYIGKVVGSIQEMTAAKWLPSGGVCMFTTQSLHITGWVKCRGRVQSMSYPHISLYYIWSICMHFICILKIFLHKGLFISFACFYTTQHTNMVNFFYWRLTVFSDLKKEVSKIPYVKSLNLICEQEFWIRLNSVFRFLFWKSMQISANLVI